MIKIFISLYIFILSMYGNELIIDKSSKEFKNFEISMYQDKNGSLEFEEIRKKNFQIVKNNVSQGHIPYPIWYYLKINNKTDKKLIYKLFLNEVFHSSVEFYILKNGYIEKKSIQGLEHTDENGDLKMTHPNLLINFEAMQTKEIYIKVDTKNGHAFLLYLLPLEASTNYDLKRNTLLTIYFTFIVSLLLYNLFLFASLKEKSYLYYVFFGFSFLLSQSALFGYFPFEKLPSIKYISYISALFPFWGIFLLLFAKTILNTKKLMPKVDKYIQYSIYLMLATTILTLLAPNIGVLFYLLFNIIFSISILVIAFLIYKKGNNTAGIYFIAQFVFLTTQTINSFFFFGIFDYNLFTRYGYLIGSMLEILLFSFALAYRTNELKKENEKNRELVDEYSKLSFLGQTVINIYHQWKTPVNNIYNSINHIEVAKEFDDKNLHNIIDSNLTQIKNNTQYLKDTVVNYLDHYKQIDQPKTICNIYNEIDSVVQLIKLESLKINLHIVIECEKDIEQNIKKNHFTNLLMILLENNIEIFKLRSIKNPFIKISVLKNTNELILKIEDNGGGIDEKFIKNIFKKHHSQSSSSGIGLYLVKEFLMPKLNGKITVKNIQDGVVFTVGISK